MRADETGLLQLADCVVREVGILDVQHQEDFHESLRAVAMPDGMQDQDLERTQLHTSGCRATYHPFLEGVVGERQAEFQLRQRGRGAAGEVGRGDDRTWLGFSRHGVAAAIHIILTNYK